MKTVNKKLQVKHYPQIPCKSFSIDVKDEAEAKRISDILANQHLWLFENGFIPDYANVITVVMWSEEDKGWEEYYNEEECMEWEEFEEAYLTDKSKQIMDYNKIAPQFNLWAPYFKEFIESEEMNKLFGHIKERAKTNKILPDSKNVFRCFAEVDPKELTCIIAGISPYHTTYLNDKKEKISIADGLALSCSSTWKDKGLQPSLSAIYNSWEKDYGHGFNPDMQIDGDLTYLAKQGVLLYNVALTVEESKVCSMNTQWEAFNKFFWTEVIGKYWRGLPILLLGEKAWKSEQYINPMQHYIIKTSHPASIAYSGKEDWDNDNCWKKIDEILWQNNGIGLTWFKTKGQKEVNNDIPQWVLGERTKKGLMSAKELDLPPEFDT